MEKVTTEQEKKVLPDLCTKKETCCGCATCYSACPTGAITLEPDEKGFLYPAISEGKCIRCYRCLQVCAFKRDRKDK